MDGKDKGCLRMYEHPKPCQSLETQRSQASAAHLMFWKLQLEHRALSLIPNIPKSLAPGISTMIKHTVLNTETP